MTPFEAGLGKFVDLTKQAFIGREALLKLNAPSETRIYGVQCEEFTPQGGFKIFDGKNEVGSVTTGAYSPYLKLGIGYVRFNSISNWDGKNLIMQTVDKQLFSCEILSLPFYDKEKELPRM
jgi:aminomethyltransferase